jgi:hypothetical protein
MDRTGLLVLIGDGNIYATDREALADLSRRLPPAESMALTDRHIRNAA